MFDTSFVATLFRNRRPRNAKRRKAGWRRGADD